MKTATENCGYILSEELKLRSHPYDLACVQLSNNQNIKILLPSPSRLLWRLSKGAGTRQFLTCGTYITIAAECFKRAVLIKLSSSVAHTWKRVLWTMGQSVQSVRAVNQLEVRLSVEDKKLVQCKRREDKRRGHCSDWAVALWWNDWIKNRHQDRKWLLRIRQ
jgi:hypothetical protein